MKFDGQINPKSYKLELELSEGDLLGMSRAWTTVTRNLPDEGDEFAVMNEFVRLLEDLRKSERISNDGNVF